MPGLDHAVGLIEHEEAQRFDLVRKLVVLSWVCSASLDHLESSALVTHRLQDIPQPTRCRDKYVYTTREYTTLLLRGHTSNNRRYAHKRWVFGLI